MPCERLKIRRREGASPRSNGKLPNKQVYRGCQPRSASSELKAKAMNYSFNSSAASAFSFLFPRSSLGRPRAYFSLYSRASKIPEGRDYIHRHRRDFAQTRLLPRSGYDCCQQVLALVRVYAVTRPIFTLARRSDDPERSKTTFPHCCVQ